MRQNLARLGRSIRFEPLVVVACAALASIAGAQEPPPAIALSPAQTYRIEVPRLKGAPVIDGYLEGDPVWQEAAHSSGFTQLEPRDGEASTERTEVYVGYDAKNLYVAFRCWTSDPKQIIASAMNRDAYLDTEDRVEIAIDTFQDHQTAFLFATNPLGDVADGTIRDNGEDVRWDWDALWSVASSRDAQGWTAEFAIPFSSLRFQSTDRPTFNVDFARYIASKHELTFWKPLKYVSGTSSRYRVSNYGEVTGFEGIQASNLFDARAYVLLGASGSAIPGALKNGGLDVKIPITSSLITDLTVNPDFAEAEADAQTLNLTRYALLLPEKREFFKEGASLFYFGDRTLDTSAGSSEQFYFFQSRRIGLAQNGQVLVPVLGGGRVTGKIGPVGLGLLNLTTSGFDDPTIGVNASLTNYSALRLNYEVPGGTTVGVMGLNKQGADGSYNRGLGADANVVVADFLRLGGYLAKTLSPGRVGHDVSGSADFLLKTKYLSFRGLYSDIGENFNPEMGYLTRSGIHKYEAIPMLTFIPGVLGIVNLITFYDFSYVTDRRGALETRFNKFEAVAFFDNGYSVALIPSNTREIATTPFSIYKNVVIQPGTYDFSTVFLGIRTDLNLPVGAVLWLDGGQLWGGTHFRSRLTLLVQPRSGFVFIGAYDREAVALPSANFVSQIASVTATYSFSPKVSTRAMFQYSSDDSARANLVLVWNYMPGANAYLIADYQRDLRGSQPWLDSFMVALKLNYTWGLSPDQVRPAAASPALSSWPDGPEDEGSLSAGMAGSMGSTHPLGMRARAPSESVR